MRAYASVADYADYLNQDPSDYADDAALLGRLAGATAVIDHLLLSAVYAVDEEGFPTEPRVINALARAASAQAQWAALTGDSTGVEAVGRAATIGSVQIPAGAVSGNPSPGAALASLIAPQAVLELRNAGLLNPSADGTARRASGWESGPW